MSWLSAYLVAPALAYLIGQIFKIIILSAKNRRFRWREFFTSGSMPSTHSAAIFALTTVIGLRDGFDSALFALSFVMTIVVAYDAMHVRRAAGEQGEVLRKLIERDAGKEKVLTEISKSVSRDAHLAKPYFSRGHRPLEVFIGAALGIVVGITVSVII
jgi:acid phosphatase family membrane protein YuiD